MAQNDLFKRYLDAGVAFTEMTRTRAQSIVKDFVRAGELQREQTQERVEELIERSRKNREHLISLVRREVSEQMQGMGLATKDDLARLEARLRSGSGSATASGPAATSPAKKAPAPKAPAPKAPSQNAPAKKAGAPASKTTKRT